MERQKAFEKVTLNDMTRMRFIEPNGFGQQNGVPYGPTVEMLSQQGQLHANQIAFPYQGFMPAGYPVPQFYPPFQNNYMPFANVAGPPVNIGVPPLFVNNNLQSAAVCSFPQPMPPDMNSLSIYGQPSAPHYQSAPPRPVSLPFKGASVFSSPGNAVEQQLLAQMQHQQQIAASGGTGNVSHLAAESGEKFSGGRLPFASGTV